MKKLISNILAGFFLVFVSASAYAVPVIDQNQPNTPNYMANFLQTNLAQSFKQAANNVAGAGIFMTSGVGSSDTVTIALWDVLPNAGGSLLASGSGIATQNSWFDVFWTPVNVIPDSTLFLVFTSANNNMGISGDNNNPYSRGQVYANAGFGTYPIYDYTFRTYAEPAPASVPEPSSIALLMFGGLMGLFIAKRKVV
ncbi:MAG: PEP-CTERM sorting domain-containing protein [Pseudomonadota bacterium]